MGEDITAEFHDGETEAQGKLRVVTQPASSSGGTQSQDNWLAQPYHFRYVPTLEQMFWGTLSLESNMVSLEVHLSYFYIVDHT